MTTKEAVDSLKQNVGEVYGNTRKQIKCNIYRGHFRSISTEIEDCIGLFLSNILPDNYKIFLDPSINIEHKRYRPDMLVVNENNEVQCIIEIKANMGYCRDASRVLQKLHSYHDTFLKAKNIRCKVGNENLKYNDAVGIYLISFTSDNCAKSNHEINTNLAQALGIKHYNLFSGTYDKLSNLEVLDFAQDILSTLKK